MAIYLLHLATRDLQLSSPGSLKKLTAVAEQHLSNNQSPLARAMLVLGKSRKGLSQEEKINIQQLLSDLAAEVPTIDRALSLIFLNKAIDLTMTDVSSLQIDMGESWEKHETELGRPIWVYTDSELYSTEIVLDTEPPQGLAAHLIYDSYAKDTSTLPITIKQNLYRLEQTGPSEFDAIAVDPGETIRASDLYVDKISLIPNSETFFRYGVLEVPLPPGAEVEPTTWGVKIADFGYDAESPFPEARHISGDLSYTIPVEVLDRPIVFHHLVRFSQTGAFTLPRIRYYRMYAPAEKAYESGNEPDFQKLVVQ